MNKVIATGVGALMLPAVLIGAVTGSLGAQASVPGADDLDIPVNMLTLYVEAAAHFAIPAPVLAGIGKVECDHDRNRACDHPNSAGAVGPMQFLPSTFAHYASASGSKTPSIYDERDAVFAAASMLFADGVNADPRAAIFAYNHDQSYVDTVLGWATTYASIGSKPALVVAAARSYLGVPYLWGGTDRYGIDCSGLVLRAFQSVGVNMPRVAQQQSTQGSTVASPSDIRPGDLLAYGESAASVDHIAIATTKTHMIEAPHKGTVVREVPIRSGSLVGIRRVLP